MASDSSSQPSFAMKTTMTAVRTKFSDVEHLSTSSAFQQLFGGLDSNTDQGTDRNPVNTGLLIVDARNAEEYEISHIEKAVNVDYQKVDVSSLLKDHIPENGGGLNNIICYCCLGYRSSEVVRKINKHYAAQKSGEDAGTIPIVYNMEGGLFKWANEDRPMIDNQGQPTVFAHRYSAIAEKLLRDELRKS